jgi:nitronate monooxygenase
MSPADSPAAVQPLLHTRLTERFGLAHPILSAPMAFVSGGALAGAVSRAGGLGLLGGGYAGLLPGEPELCKELALLQGQRCGVGFITWALQQRPWVLDELLERFTPACLVLSFGDPRPWARRLQQDRIPLLCQVQTLQQARLAIEAGAAAIIAQGQEAGGHGGGRGLFPLVPELADHLARHAPDTLLLAAGGIADGRGLAAALLLGADGVVMGSRFVACTAALAPPAALQRILQASGDETVRTTIIDALRGVSWPEEFSFRVLRNALTAQWAHREAEAMAARGSWSARYEEARKQQDYDTAAVVVGEAVGLIQDVQDAHFIIRHTVEQAATLLGQKAGILVSAASALSENAKQ